MLRFEKIIGFNFYFCKLYLKFETLLKPTHELHKAPIIIWYYYL